MTPSRETKQQLLARIAELQKSEAKWRSLISHAPIFIAIVDRRGVIQFLNRTQPGHEWDAVHEPRIQDYIHPTYREQALACLESVFRTGHPTSYETLAAGPNGTEIWYETLLGPVKEDEAIVAVALLSTDITARKKAERELREAHAMLEEQSHLELQAIYDGMVDGLLIAEQVSTRFVRANQAICRMLDYSEQELLALTVRDIHPRDELPKVLERFQSLATGKLAVAEDIAVLRKDGSIFYADIAANLLQYQGRPCLIGFFRDNTERRQAAEALQREHQVLHQLLKSQDRDRQIVAYEIHDGVAQLLAAAMMQFETYRHMRRDAPKAAEQSAILVADLLQQCHAEVRRLISGLRPPVLDGFGIIAALQHLVYESIAQWESDIDFQHDVKFARLEPSLENAIYRIAQESLTNACQHSKSTKIQLQLTQHDESVRISVQDWGTGFDPQSTGEKCFGLAGIRQRVRLLGGSVSIATRLGEGSHIVVELPLATGSVDIQMPDAPPTRAQPARPLAEEGTASPHDA